ncbi:MAG TPA: hypothetical protein VMG12_09125, partial [Polyangiaceae bacterium]|nr:hypothetical protein [Polyangiaceae bacterium]
LTQALHSDPKSFRRYGEPPDQRVGSVEAPRVTAVTNSVSFYDSMIVFEKRLRPEPWHEIR